MSLLQLIKKQAFVAVENSDTANSISSPIAKPSTELSQYTFRPPTTRPPITNPFTRPSTTSKTPNGNRDAPIALSLSLPPSLSLVRSPEQQTFTAQASEILAASAGDSVQPLFDS